MLVVDDDDDVHVATAFALDYVEILGRGVRLTHARSAQEAREILLRERDFAVVLLDVVMETTDAGLQLVHFIRETAGLSALRIVLRTGQPGYAPEQQTLEQYDINDYKAKSELTRPRLLATITAAVRSYQQIRSIEMSRRGLQRIIDASADLLARHGLRAFADGVLTQLAALLDTEPEGLVCAHACNGQAPYTVLAAAGVYADLIGQPLDALGDHPSVQRLMRAMQQRRSLYLPQETVLFVQGQDAIDLAVYLPLAHHLEPDTQRLIDVFCLNLSAYLRNLSLIERLQQLAYRDARLELPNRTWLVERIGQLVGDDRAGGYALAIVDIDDFSGINELMGHEFADDVLQALIERLRASLPTYVEMARVSGDGLALLGPQRERWLPTLPLAWQNPVRVRGQPFQIRATVGWVNAEDFEQSGMHAIKNAATALKDAKRHARGGVVQYARTMSVRSRHHAELLDRLHHAFHEHELFLVYQPQVDLVTRAVIGAEALLRWRRPDGQLIPPDTFIPVAEQSGLIDALGAWVMQQACADLRSLHQQGIGLPRVAVNVSAVQFRSPCLLERIQQALQRHELSAHHLELEITESVAMLSDAQVEPLLRQMRGMGIGIALDDFGTGYSSLAYLERLPLDRIKIDRGFVQQLGQNTHGARIAEVIIELGQRLQLPVLAEGIEDEASWRQLREMGCQAGQGYWFSPPMPLSALVTWWQHWHESGIARAD
ncbi:putative bifunctional diguanylate cyclase/phosphodiesterase [Tepidimonas taiwanensis]|uniref:putative bifunctional diguanylate cyclase/phosphodiesterase n=1 Tax=Tepidimonas taiwanensis TaxID=307486 RepID=UPI00068FA66A|nr:EAL domain-containing protein [Tepidimonas taiwanensis]